MGLLARLVNRIFFRDGAQSVVNRLIRRNVGIGSGARLLTDRPRGSRLTSNRLDPISTDALLADAPPPSESAPPLISGFKAFVEGEHRKDRARSEPRSPDNQSPDSFNVAPMLLSADRFDTILKSTPSDLRSQVLVERKEEYSEYLRRLERARKTLVQRLEEVDSVILEAVNERRAIEDQLSAEPRVDEKKSCSRSTTADTLLSGTRPQTTTSTKARFVAGEIPKSMVEDVSDSGDDMDDRGLYEQDDITRLRKLASVYSGHYGGITAIDCDPAMGLLASGSLDTQVRVWDIETTACKYTITSHNDIIRGVQFYDRFLLTASNDSRIRMWDLSMLESVCPQPATMEMQKEYIPSSLLADADLDEVFGRNRSATRPASPNTTLTLQSTTPAVTPTICRRVLPIDLCCENTFIGHADAVTCFQASADGTLISGSADKTVREWDLTTGTLRQTIDITWAISDTQTKRLSGNLKSSFRRNSPWATTGNPLSSTSRSPLPFETQDFDAAARFEAYKRGTEFGDGGFIGALQFYEFALATGTADGFLRLWDLRTTQAHRQMHGHSEPITSLHFDDRSVVTGSLDGTVLLWDLRTGRILQTLAFESGIVTSAQLRKSADSHSSKSYAMECWTATRDNSLHYYKANSMQHISYASDYGYMNSAASKSEISPISAGTAGISRISCLDSESLVCGDDEGIIKLWHI
ncbi:Mitochondrial fission protein [Coemansia spiralis]|uniref:Mitochondrial fission protein n=1 Tax=Coemansia spiralis TaxID=417178 RepID=A0A9W8G6S5_9FUNG|nr:Mitochondrial fission protein [Coemansia spiralis]